MAKIDIRTPAAGSVQLDGITVRSELGAFVADVRAAYGGWLGAGLIGLGLCLLSLFKAIHEQDGAMGFLAALVALPTLPMLVKGLVLRGRRLIRFENGMIFRDNFSTKQVVWPELESISQKVVSYSVNFLPVGTAHQCWVRTFDGWRYLLDNNFPGAPQIAHDLQNQIWQCRLPGMFADLKAGKAVDFGALNVDRSRIRYGRIEIAWSELESVNFRNGVLQMQRSGDKMGKVVKGATLLIRAEAVPNLPMLLEIVKRLQAAAQSRPQ